MSAENEQLAIEIVAKLGDLEKQMAKANGVTARAYREMSLNSKRATTQMESDAIRSSLRVRQAMAQTSATVGAFGRAFAVAGATFISADKIVAASQAYIRASNALKVAGLSGEALTATYERLYRIAQDNSAPVETLVGLYAKAAQAQTSLGATNEQLIAFTTATAQALRVQGRSAAESSGALLQLGQALTSGTVHAEEYNSLQEGAYPLLQAVAAGLKEAGGEVSKLTALVKDGKVSSAAFFNAALAGAPILGEKLAGAADTLSAAWTRFTNSLEKSVGMVDSVVGATKGAVTVLSEVATIVEGIAQTIKDISTEVAKVRNLANVGNEKAQSRAPRAYAMSPDGSFSQIGEDTTGQGGPAKPLQHPISKPRAAVKPVSLKDYPITGDGKGEKLNDYEREVRAIKEKTVALGVDIEMVGRSTEETAKATEAQKLKTAAEREGLTLTPERLAEIEKVASAYAAQTAALEKANTAHSEFNELQRFAGQSIAGFFSDIVSGGQNASQALMNLTKRLADAAIQAALLGDGPLAGILGTKGTGGNVGGLIGAMFSGFRADGGPVSAGRAYVVGERRPELFVPRSSGTIIPAVPKMPGGGAPRVATYQGGPISVTVQSNGAQSDQRTGAAIATAVRHAVRSEIADFARAQMRPGGIMTRKDLTA